MGWGYGYGYAVFRHFQQYFGYIVAVSFISGAIEHKRERECKYTYPYLMCIYFLFIFFNLLITILSPASLLFPSFTLIFLSRSGSSISVKYIHDQKQT